MKKSNKKTLRRLEKQLKQAAHTLDIPAALEPDAMEQALEQAETEPSAAPKKHKLPPRVLYAAAAVLLLLCGIAAFSPLKDTLFRSANVPIAADPLLTAQNGADTHVGTQSDNKDGSTAHGSTAATSAASVERTTAAAVKKSAHIQQVSALDEIEKLFQKMEKNKDQYGSVYDYGAFIGGNGAVDASPPKAAPPMAANTTSPGAATGAPGAAREPAEQSSETELGKTNVQVEGVDEADIVKNDGKFLYIASTNQSYNDTTNQTKYSAQVQIVALQANGKMKNEKLLSVVSSEMGEYVVGMFLQNSEKLVVITQKGDYYTRYHGYAAGYSTTGAKTLYRVYDIRDKGKPTLLKTYSQDGSYLSARLVGEKLLVISNHNVNLHREGFDLKKDIYPTSGPVGQETRLAATDLYVTKNDPTPSYLVVTVSKLNSLDKEPEKAAVLGCGSEIYCSGDTLYAARTLWSNTEKTELYRFSVKEKPVFEASASVNGQLLNQFSMDEYNGHVRIATTQNGSKTSSNVFVLDGKLKTVGKVTGIAPGETIQSVRFTGKTGYVVTFRQTDPLFVLDLADPKAPKIMGELKIPGFSSYLHPVSDTLLIGLGYPGDENGTTPGIKLSLFDVSDPKNPREVDQETLEGDIFTAAMSNHKALSYNAASRRFIIPTLVPEFELNKHGSAVSEKTLFAAHSFLVDTTAKTLRSEKAFSCATLDSYRYPSDERVTYVGDTLYTLAAGKIFSFSIDSGKKLDTLALT